MFRFAMILIALLAAPAGAVTLPVHCDFDADTPDAPPATGGTDQPSSFIIPPGGSVLVKAAALGLADQPCLIDQGSGDGFGSVNFIFDPLAEDLLVFEATLVVNQYCASFLMQTASSSGAVVSRIRTLADGSLVNYDMTPLGSYMSGQPFRCRMVVNLEDENWDFTLDDELNGFADDPVLEDLGYTNNPSVIDDVAQAMASLGYSGIGGGLQVAYDDIVIRTEDYTPAAGSSWSELKTGY